MDTLALLVGVLLCLTVVSARGFDERRDKDPVAEAEEEGLKKHGSDRHRRRRWQMNYGYEYQPPIQPYYHERERYDRSQQDLMPKIVALLEEISAYIRRPQPPPPPPQPIYIPYPVPYAVPQYLPCPGSTTKKPNITSRFPEMEDTNQNWGFVMSEEDNGGYEDDGARPISFDPITPLRKLKRPAPKVEHGSVQSGSQSHSQTTQAPKFEGDVPLGRAPIMCNAAILSCCADDEKQQRQCFNGFGCGVTYNNGKACETESVNEALNAFKQAYSPVP